MSEHVTRVVLQRSVYMKKTGLPLEKITKLYEQFELYAKPTSLKGGGAALMIDYQKFTKLSKKYNIGSSIANTLFRRAETLDCTMIDFGDYLSIVAVFLEGTKELQVIVSVQICCCMLLYPARCTTC